MNFIIRNIEKTEFSFLEKMLFEAIFIPDGEEKLPTSIIFIPELYRYIQLFGQKNDICLVVVLDNELVGAAWTRIYAEIPTGMPAQVSAGYGYLDDQTPELSMAIQEKHRNKGIGTQLLQKMIDKLKTLKYYQVSLSVDNRNFAYQLYQKLGFVDVETTENSVIMKKIL